VGGQKHTAVTAVVASITAEHKNGLPTVDLVTIFFYKAVYESAIRVVREEESLNAAG